jgi:signal transduction histidine kinase
MAAHQDGGGIAAAAGAASQFAADAPDGLAAVDTEGRFVWLNPAGVRLCGRSEANLIGAPAPFGLPDAEGADGSAGPFDDGPVEHVTAWSPAEGIRREFAYRAHLSSASPCLIVVSFRDVTGERHRQRRIAAIARAGAKLASQGPLTTILDALAAEVLQADALAGVQILTLDETGRGLRMMGSAGFRHWPDFFERLMECRRRGAALRMLDALHRGEPVIVANRWPTVRDDPAWSPLHDYLGELKWDSFASVPLMIRGRAAGVLNAFLAPGQAVGQRTIEFLVAMAEQAAIAVDYAALMQRERDAARRDERQRLARDLHDSIVQQVFSISMQASALDLLGRRGDQVPAEAVRRIADEVSQLSGSVHADLRALLHELRPSGPAHPSRLEEAIRSLSGSTETRTGLRVRLRAGAGLERVDSEMAGDTYRIIGEAIHNIVKHAAASEVLIELDVRGDELTATVADDGNGIGAPGAPACVHDPDAGYGLGIMRERAERWGGSLTVRRGQESGTVVRLTMPLAAEHTYDGLVLPVGPSWTDRLCPGRAS